MGTVLKWHNVPRIPFRPSFGRGPVSTLSSGLQFSSKTMSLSRKEHHTGTAYSRIGLTRYLYNKENSVCYTGFRPKHALSDPKDSVSFVDDFVNMIAPWEIARYRNTEIFWYFSRSLDFHHLDKECIAPFRLMLFVTYSHCFKFIWGLNFNCHSGFAPFCRFLKVETSQIVAHASSGMLSNSLLIFCRLRTISRWKPKLQWIYRWRTLWTRWALKLFPVVRLILPESAWRIIAAKLTTRCDRQ